jgi:lysophospholipase L1-like esterase
LLPEHDGRLLFSFGANDCCAGPNGKGVRVSASDTLLNTDAILGEASAWRPTLMVGPPPVGDAETDRRIAALSWAFGELCARMGVPYLPLFDVVARSRSWAFEVAAGDGAHPNGGGYADVAIAFMDWGPWRRWAEIG